MSKMRIACKGYFTLSTPNGGSEFDCEYESGIGCADCICNAGDLSPVTGKKFRGNRKPYEDDFTARIKALEEKHFAKIYILDERGLS